MDIWQVVLGGAAILITVLVLDRKAKAPNLKPTKSAPPKATQSAKQIESFHWEGDGSFEFMVVGESHYQRTLAKLAGDHGNKNARAAHRAILSLEDFNRHDPKAVAVRIEGETVGYLTREDARSYRRRLGQKGLTGIDASCDALVVGGGKSRSGEKKFYGVVLDMKAFGS